MGMVVRSNMMAANANRQLGMNNTAVTKSLEKLSSGFKINRAGDDASGLAISEKMKAQIKGLETASANAQDGISLVQTAEGALTEVHSMLNRMTELATKSANGTSQDLVDREALQSEVDSLRSEIDRISQSTNFNGINLLDGSMAAGVSVTSAVVAGTSKTATDIAATTSSFAVTAAAGTAGAHTLSVTYNDEKGVSNTVTLNYTSTNAKPADATAMAGAITGNATLSKLFDVADDGAGNLTITSKATGAAAAAISSITSNDATGIPVAGTATAGTDAGKSIAGALAKGDNFTVNGKTFYILANGDNKNLAPEGSVAVNLGAGATANADTQANLQAALKEAGIKDVTVAYNGAKLDLTASATSSGLSLQVGDTADSFNNVSVSVADMSTKGLKIDSLSVATKEGAGAAIKTIKDAINLVSTNRANLGAVQNRLEHTINNLDVTTENMNAANSRIRDTDMAKEMMNYTKMNVLTQAAQAMLAQANQQPQSVLQLLQ